MSPVESGLRDTSPPAQAVVICPPQIGAARAVSRRRLQLELLLKRAVDISTAALLLVLLFPLLLVTALAIRLSCGAPVLFRQERWGLDEKTFTCLKFRTMRTEPPPPCLDLPRPAGALLKMKNDPRVTPLGAFLRKTSIDELPQLLNVLSGSMSLVGPRPLMRHMLEPFPELRKARCVVRPGVTGLWQISARHLNTTALDMASYDTEYIRRFSLVLDARIIMKTIPALFRADGAF